MERQVHGRPPSNVFAAFGLAALLFTLPGGPPDSPVADAAQRGDIQQVRSLLRDGADVNAAQGDGMTALHWAALHDDATMIETLVYAGGNVESTTRLGAYTPLHIAAKEARPVAIGALLEAGADVQAVTSTGVRPIHFAAETGNVKALTLLIDGGADMNVREDYSGRTPLMFATANNRLDAMALLIERGADVSIASNVIDYTKREELDDAERERRERIMAAARDPEPEEEEDEEEPASATVDTTTTAPDPDSTATVPDSSANEPDEERRARQERAERKAATAQPDPDSPTPSPDSAAAKRPMSYTDLVGTQGGLTPLHYAVRDGREEAARLLLAAGSDINGVTLGDQTSPLLMAIINGNYDLAMYLLENGADPNLASDDGAAPLFATINQEWHLRTWYPQPTAQQQQKTTYLELMRALLEAGADPNKRLDHHIWYAAYNAGRMGVDFAGATAFWRAAYATDVDAMRLLADYGADPNIPTIKPPSRRRRGIPGAGQDTTEAEEDPSGLPPVPDGGPAVHPLHAASGVGYGTSRVGQQHRHVPDGWVPAVQYLVGELGVDVNVRDHDGYSAVHNAAARGDNEMIEYLVSMGADVTFVSRRGQTTVDMANGPQQRVQPFPETIALLEGLGAKNNHNCQSCE